MQSLRRASIITGSTLGGVIIAAVATLAQGSIDDPICYMEPSDGSQIDLTEICGVDSEDDSTSEPGMTPNNGEPGSNFPRSTTPNGNAGDSETPIADYIAELNRGRIDYSSIEPQSEAGRERLEAAQRLQNVIDSVNERRIAAEAAGERTDIERTPAEQQEWIDASAIYSRAIIEMSEAEE